MALERQRRPRGGPDNSSGLATRVRSDNKQKIDEMCKRFGISQGLLLDTLLDSVHLAPDGYVTVSELDLNVSEVLPLDQSA